MTIQKMLCCGITAEIDSAYCGYHLNNSINILMAYLALHLESHMKAHSIRGMMFLPYLIISTLIL